MKEMSEKAKLSVNFHGSAATYSVVRKAIAVQHLVSVSCHDFYTEK